MSNAAGYAALDKMIASLRAVPAVMKQLGPAVATELRTELTRTLNAGTSPDGSAWAERKEGGRAYAGAAKALTVTSHGATVLASISGPEVYGHRGVRGAPRRPMLPSGLTGRLLAVFTRRASDLLQKHFG